MTERALPHRRLDNVRNPLCICKDANGLQDTSCLHAWASLARQDRTSPRGAASAAAASRANDNHPKALPSPARRLDTLASKTMQAAQCSKHVGLGRPQALPARPQRRPVRVAAQKPQDEQQVKLQRREGKGRRGARPCARPHARNSLSPCLSPHSTLNNPCRSPHPQCASVRSPWPRAWPSGRCRRRRPWRQTSRGPPSRPPASPCPSLTCPRFVLLVCFLSTASRAARLPLLKRAAGAVACRLHSRRRGLARAHPPQPRCYQAPLTSFHVSIAGSQGGHAQAGGAQAGPAKGGPAQGGLQGAREHQRLQGAARLQGGDRQVLTNLAWLARATKRLIRLWPARAAAAAVAASDAYKSPRRRPRPLGRRWRCRSATTRPSRTGRCPSCLASCPSWRCVSGCWLACGRAGRRGPPFQRDSVAMHLHCWAPGRRPCGPPALVAHSSHLLRMLCAPPFLAPGRQVQADAARPAAARVQGS